MSFNIPLFEWMDSVQVIKQSYGSNRWMLADLQGNRVESLRFTTIDGQPTSYLGAYFETKKAAIESWRAYHKHIVKNKLENNLPILKTVLEDYPDLLQQYKYKESLDKWDKELKDLEEANRRSEQITAEDLNIRLT